MKKSPDFYKLREDFPMLKKSMHGKPLIYLDSAATSQKPQAVIDSLTDFYQNQYGTVHRAVYELAVFATQMYQEARKKIQKFIHAAQSHEILFTRGTTESINMIAYSFGKAFIKPHDEIIISEIEHHSNIVPWQILCEDRGAILRIIPVNQSGEVLLEEYGKLLNERTKLVAITHISNSLGTCNPIKEIAAMAHQAGAKILVDAAQSAPHMPIDVQDLDVDFLAFSGHKICGPTGVGILYGKEALLEALPPYQGGGDMIDTVTFEKTTYNVLPLKFEAGTPMFAEIIALGAAIDYLTSIGMEHINKHDQNLLAYATERMSAIPNLMILGTARKKGAIISFIVEGIHPLDLGTLLDLRGVAIRTGHLCAQPATRHFSEKGFARASFYLYNTKEEIDGYIAALNDVIKMLR
jgi:cysteine desulfurase/selenocysteine lyase